MNKWKGNKDVSFNSITKVYNNGESKDVTDFYLKNPYSKGEYADGGRVRGFAGGNKITENDFEEWIQERSIYNAEKIDSNYKRILGFNDFGETQEQDGSLIIADYGKGKFVYTGLALFRQLPAGVPGAYRLLANLLATKLTPEIEKPKTKKPNVPLTKSKVVFKNKN